MFSKKNIFHKLKFVKYRKTLKMFDIFLRSINTDCIFFSINFPTSFKSNHERRH